MVKMNEMKLNGKSKDIIQENVSKLKEIFPEIVTENKIDFDKLKLILGECIEYDFEKYTFTWPGKSQVIKESQKTSYGTLKPCKEESKNWDLTENLYIEGDNLEVLKLLQKTHYNKIKTIYIDPPYNTGNDLIYQNNYEDNLTFYLKLTGQLIKNESEGERERESIGINLTTNVETNGRFHSNWLNLMYPRLKLARNLLTDDGSIIIAIDHNELANLIEICDELFGSDNRIGIITVVHKPEGRNQEKFFATSNEFVLFYAKNKEKLNFNPIIINDDYLKDYQYMDEKGAFKLNSFIAKNHGRQGFDKNLRINNPKNYYPIYVSPDLKEITLKKKEDYYMLLPNTKTQERTWKLIKESFLKKVNDGEIIAKKDNNGEVKLFEKYRITKGQLIKTHWIEKKYNANTRGTKVINDLMKVKTFDFPKSLDLIMDCLKLTLSKNDLVMDFFSGSATTAHATMQLNSEDNGKRKFIMVQIPELTDEKSEAYKAGYKNICEIGKERIRRAGDKILEESDNKDLDIGFKVFKLDSSNLEKWDPDYDNLEQTLLTNKENIKPDRTELDLIYEIMLKYGINLTLPIEKINNIYSIGYGALLICLEDNITKEIAEEIIKIKSDNITRVVFKDSGFKSDADKTNIKETLRINNIDEFITI